METQNTKSKSTDIVAQTTTTIRRMIAPAVVTAMMFALFAFTGTRSSFSASGPGSQLLGSPSPAASEVTCEGRITKTYFDSSRGDLPVLPTPFFPFVFTGGRSILKGYLYLPDHSTVADSHRNLPLIVFNHGSERSAYEYCEVATYFTDKGFAFFIPYRRGQGLSTGMYYTDFLDLICGRSDQNPFGTCGRVGNNAFLLSSRPDP